eukprot:2271981-Amphidinium_carterae.1
MGRRAPGASSALALHRRRPWRLSRQCSELVNTSTPQIQRMTTRLANNRPSPVPQKAKHALDKYC